MALLETNAITRLATVSSLEMSNTTSAQTLYTVPATKESGAAVTGCAITHILHHGAQVSLTTAEWGYGFNSTLFDDVIGTTSHPSLTGSTAFLVLTAKAGARVGVPGDVLKTQVSIGQGTTSNILAVDIFGLLW